MCARGGERSGEREREGGKRSIKQENHKSSSDHFAEVNVTKLITEIRSIRCRTGAVNSRLYSVVSVASIIFPTMPAGPGRHFEKLEVTVPRRVRPPSYAAEPRSLPPSLTEHVVIHARDFHR